MKRERCGHRDRSISGGVFEGDEIYVAQGDELVIDALTLINNTDKEGALGAVSYYWDHYLNIPLNFGNAGAWTCAPASVK